MEARFLGKTKVVYHFFQKQDIIPDSCRVEQMELEYWDGQGEIVEGTGLCGAPAVKLRNGMVKSLIIRIGKADRPPQA
ncbi:hypothetical protein D3C81_2212660 [compost metagenome]